MIEVLILYLVPALIGGALGHRTFDKYHGEES
ncbi:hypothetical protein QOZ91_002375 [Clostridium sardiniense]|nr:hypothetical protein [Clostridium sardiniense]